MSIKVWAYAAALAALGVSFKAGACSDGRVAFPAERLEPFAVGEDEGPVAYYQSEAALFVLAADDGGDAVHPYTTLRVHALDENAPPVEIAAPGGRRYDPDRVHVADDGSVAVLALVGAPARVLLVELASARVLADRADGSVTFESDRVRVAGVAADLCTRLAAIVPRPAWRDAIWDAHRVAVEQAREIAAAVLADMRGAYVDATARAELEALLAAKAQPMEIGALSGRWRVRSLKVSLDALFAYPYFNAELVIDGADPVFRKTSGSQRRSGRLFAFGDGLSWVFIGAATVNDEPARDYSRRAGAAAPDKADSVGRLWALTREHAYLVLDAQHDVGFEVYELRRARP